MSGSPTEPETLSRGICDERTGFGYLNCRSRTARWLTPGTGSSWTVGMAT